MLQNSYKDEKIKNLSQYNLPDEYRRAQSPLWRKLNPLIVCDL